MTSVSPPGRSLPTPFGTSCVRMHGRPSASNAARKHGESNRVSRHVFRADLKKHLVQRPARLRWEVLKDSSFLQVRSRWRLCRELRDQLVPSSDERRTHREALHLTSLMLLVTSPLIRSGLPAREVVGRLCVPSRLSLPV